MSTDLGDDAMSTVQITTDLNQYYKEQLEMLVRMKRISSVTEGINIAVGAYVKAMKKSIYEEQMQAAAKDQDFMERTLIAQQEFEFD